VLGLVIIIQVALVATGIFGAPLNCARAIKEHNPELLAGARIYRRSWGRTLENHYIGAAVLQPTDISHSPVTVVCHFQGREWIHGRLELHEGDQLDRIVAASTSNLDPSTWESLFEDLLAR
jgi:hypothetical protein